MRIAYPTKWLLLSVGVGAFVAALDVALGPASNLGGLLLMCPLLAATRLNGGRTAVVGGSCVLLAVLVADHEGTLGRFDEVLLMIFLVVAAVHATSTARRHTTTHAYLAELAATAQPAILQPTYFRVGGLAVCARYRSAAPRAVIGGDLYAFAHTPNGLRLLLGDVHGENTGRSGDDADAGHVETGDALQLSATVIGHFRDCAFTHTDLADVVRETDRRLAEELGEQEFITAMVAEFAPGRLRLANCGHHPPLHLSLDGPPSLIHPAEPTAPIGRCPAPLVQQVKLAPGDRVLFYTDGIAEARDPQGVSFDPADLAPACGFPRLGDALDMVLLTLAQHTHNARDDDVALILVESATSPPRPRRGRGSGRLDLFSRFSRAGAPAPRHVKP
ncbi:PP2C family protein-serine/threonine phosphatase [Streptomyces sp. MST-110588]|uniref:PP2C family protein-serine/threonine phosphatase n=1 Tax=Streptomyces sp. MST-110588 TaxID=2833628 RepID=UPI001F5D4E9C|nr:PP2C family protein-serine/threonine phosphatase [Streptomyces sp. MST-110588]UNO41622.1 serine/threonine-protein phosphatase [Streptomyces sp. MST-110588]